MLCWVPPPPDWPQIGSQRCTKVIMFVWEALGPTPHSTVHCNDANTNKEPSLSDFTGVGFQGNIKLFVKLAPHQLTHTRFHSRIAHRLHFIHNVIIKYGAHGSHESYIVPCVWQQTCQVRRQTVMMTYWLVCVPRVARTVPSHRQSAVVVLIFSVGLHWRLHNWSSHTRNKKIKQNLVFCTSCLVLFDCVSYSRS